MDQSTTRAFLSNTLPATEWVDKMKIYFFDGEKEMGRLPLEVWDDTSSPPTRCRTTSPERRHLP